MVYGAVHMGALRADGMPVGKPLVPGDKRRGPGFLAPKAKPPETARTLARKHRASSIEALVSIRDNAMDAKNPDAVAYDTRLRAAKLLLEYSDGTPAAVAQATPEEEKAADSAAADADAKVLELLRNGAAPDGR